MAEHVGIIVKSENKGYADVIVDRKGGCGDCHPGSGGCRSCLASAQMESRVFNPVNAKAGDVVKIRLSSTHLFTGAAALYLLPVAGILLGAFAGNYMAGVLGWSLVLTQMGGALAGLVAGYGIVMLMDRNLGIQKRMTPHITAIIGSQGNNNHGTHPGKALSAPTGGSHEAFKPSGQCHQCH